MEPATDVASRDVAAPRVPSYLFATEAGVPLRRRPVDVWRLVVATVVFLLLGWYASGDPPLDERIAVLFADLPAWLRVFAWVGFSGATLAGLGLLGASLARGGVARGVLRDLGLTTVVAVTVGLIAGRVTTGAWPNLLPEVIDSTDQPAYPALRSAIVVTIVLVLTPYLTAPTRRFGRWVMGAAVVSPILLGLSELSGALGSVALGALSVAVVRAVLGSPEGLPPIDRLDATLRRVGLRTTELAYVPEQPGTVGIATARADDGSLLTIKVYGRDATDRQRAVRVWRSLWYRPSGITPASGRVQQVEHEALVLLAAERNGLPVPRVVKAGQDLSGDVVLVTAAAEGTPLGELSEDALDDATMGELWRLLGRLRHHGATHGSLGAHSIRIGPEGPSLVDLGHASLLPTDQQYGADLAALLGSTAAVVGPERAVLAAVNSFSTHHLRTGLPYIQDAVVDPNLRTWMKHSHVTFDEIRDLLVSELEVEAPEIAEVRRVKAQDVVMVAFAILAANAIVSQIAEVGWSTLFDELQAASIGWLIVALLIKAVSYSTPYMGLQAVVDQPVPLGPTVLLQSARSFVGLVVPSAVGRVAMDVRFLQKLGVSTSTAVTQGPVISFIGFLVEIALLGLTSWAIGQEIEADQANDQSSGGLLLIALVVVAVGIALIAAIPKLRAWVVPKVTAATHEIRSIVSSPGRLAKVSLSELLERLVGALALAAVVIAFGADVPFVALIFVSVGTGLLAGIAPVPGGVGVAEATMTALLTTVGLPSEQAFSIAITYRLLTSYLPPLAGFFSLNWLKNHGHM